MKRYDPLLARSVAVLLALLVSAACGGGGGGGGGPAPVVTPALIVTTSTLPDGINGGAYDQSLTASGGTPPYTWSLSSGSLPNALMFRSDGQIIGVLMQTGTFGFTVQVQDSVGRTATRALSIRIGDPLVINTMIVPVAALNTPYSETLSASGGIGALTWSIPTGALPTGVTLNAMTGVISGPPAVSGLFFFTVQVVDSSNPQQSTTQPLSISVAEQLAITTNPNLPPAIVTQPYSTILEAIGGTPPYTWSAPSGVPPGLSLDPMTGELSGVPTEVSFFNFDIQVADSTAPPLTGSANFGLGVRPLPDFSTTSFPDGAQGVEYGGSINVFGGEPPYTVQLVAGTVPNGFVIISATSPANLGFSLTGIPDTVGDFSFTLEVADSSSPPLTATRDFSLRINEQLFITSTTLPEGLEGTFYMTTLTATGGVPPYVWQVFGSFPSGLTLDPFTGVIDGTPTAPFDAPISLRVEDSGNFQQFKTAQPVFKITGLLGIGTSSVPDGSVGKDYETSLAAVGGTPPFTWSLMAGSLPSGLSLDPSTGQITGLPDTEETASFTVQVADSGMTFPQSDTQDLSIAIGPRLGRNDTIATATLLSNGQSFASISPYADPAAAPTSNPDQDFYQLSANAGATVRVEIFAHRLVPISRLDSVIEITDSNGIRFTTCRPAGSAGSFNQPCLNDDLTALNTLDSGLEFQVPGAGVVTFFVRVLDFRGDARPDLHYRIDIAGAN